MRERTPSADDTPKRAPPAPPREAASADVAGSKTSSEAAELVPASKFSLATTTSSTSGVDARMVASTHNLEDLGVSHPASASSQQQQEKPTYRSAQTAQDKRSRLSNVINNLLKKVPDSRNGESPKKEEDERNSSERNIESLQQYVMTVLQDVIKDEENDEGKEVENGKEVEKLPEEDEDSKEAKFEPSKPNESRTEAVVFLSEQLDKSSECSLRDEESEENSLETISEKPSSVEEEQICNESKCSSKETKSEDQPVQETANCQEEEKKENRSLGTIIMERLSENQTEEKVNADTEKEFVGDNVELRSVCRDLLNDLLNGLNHSVDEKTEESKVLDSSAEESKDSRTQDFCMTSLHCSLPLDKVASVLPNCQPNDLAVPRSPSSSSQGAKSANKPRHLCLYCDRKFMTISLRQRHTERVHQQARGRRSERNSRKPSQNCLHCSEKCAEGLENLFQHMVRNHSDRYHACLQCSTRYLTRDALADHMSENHAVQRNLQIEENMKEPSPQKELGNQSPRDRTEAQNPKESEHESRAESILLKPTLQPKDNFSNPGSPEFDSSFYSSVSCNIRENLLHHLDGKLQSTSSTITNTLITDAKPQQTFYEHNVIQFPIDISLTAATPVYSKEYGNEEYENNSEYAQKPGKSNRSYPRRVSFEKFNFPRKYDGKEQWSCSIKDLSKFDISTQLCLRKKQQLLKEHLTLNRLHQIPLLVPSTTDIVQDEQSLSSRSSQEFDNVDEASAGASSPEIDKMSSCEPLPECKRVDGCQVKSSLATEFSMEFGDFLRLRKWNEKTSMEEAKKQEIVYAELTGEWSRPRVYICGACNSKHVTLREMEDHKATTHPNVWCSHFEFSGDQRELYKHLFLPGKSVATAKAKAAILVEKVCTKCSKNCTTLPELHRHMLECGGDQAWLLGFFGNGKKKCKWRPFGSRSRRRRQRGMKRNIQNSQTPRVNTPKEKQATGPRIRPSDRESIQKMLANLPPKRATRKVLQDSTLRTQGRLRSVQTRTRRMVGNNSTVSRMTRNKAVLRNKLLKNAKTNQRNRCRIDNISAVIESVVKNYIPQEKKLNNCNSSGKTDLEKETKDKTEGSLKENTEQVEGNNRTKVVRGPKVLGKRRNAKTREGTMKNLDEMKKPSLLKAKAKGTLKNSSATKTEASNEPVKTLKSTTKASSIIVEKEEDDTEKSPKNKSPTQITPRKRRTVDPVASLNASIKAKSQLRTQDGKFAKNPNKDSLLPQKFPEMKSSTKGKSNEISSESSVTRSKLRAVSRLKNELPKRTTRLSSDSDKMPTLEPAVQVSSGSDEFPEATNDLPILSPATSASGSEKVLRGKTLVNKLNQDENSKNEDAEESKDQKQGKGRRAKDDMNASKVVKEKLKRKSAPARISNVEEKKTKSSEEAKKGKLETRSKAKLDKDDSPIKIQNVPPEVKKLIGSDNKEDLLVKLALTSRIATSKRRLRQSFSTRSEEVKLRKEDLEKGKADLGSITDASSKKEKDINRKSLRMTDKKEKVVLEKTSKVANETKTGIRGRRSSSLCSDSKVTSSEKLESENTVQNIEKRQTRGSLLNSNEGETQSELSDLKKNTIGRKRGRIKSNNETAEKKSAEELETEKKTEESQMESEETVKKIDLSLEQNEESSEDKVNVEIKEDENTEKEEFKDADCSTNNLNNLETGNSMDSGKENAMETRASVQKLKVGRPRKSWGVKKERTSKRSLNNVIGILTEGKNIPAEAQQTVLNVQTVVENVNVESLQSTQLSDDDKSQNLGKNNTLQDNIQQSDDEKSQNLDKNNTLIQGNIQQPHDDESQNLNINDTIQGNIQQPYDDKSQNLNKNDTLQGNIQQSDDDKLQNLSKNNVLEATTSPEEFVTKTEDSKQLEEPKVLLKNPPKECQEIESSSKVITEQSLANDIILDLSRRKQKGKGSFLEKIVSKIAKQKDAVLEGAVGSLLDIAADELTSILDEVAPGLPENSERKEQEKQDIVTTSLSKSSEKNVQEKLEIVKISCQDNLNKIVEASTEVSEVRGQVTLLESNLLPNGNVLSVAEELLNSAVILPELVEEENQKAIEEIEFKTQFKKRSLDNLEKEESLKEIEKPDDEDINKDLSSVSNQEINKENRSNVPPLDSEIQKEAFVDVSKGEPVTHLESNLVPVLSVAEEFPNSAAISLEKVEEENQKETKVKRKCKKRSLEVYVSQTYVVDYGSALSVAEEPPNSEEIPLEKIGENQEETKINKKSKKRSLGVNLSKKHKRKSIELSEKVIEKSKQVPSTKENDLSTDKVIDKPEVKDWSDINELRSTERCKEYIKKLKLEKEDKLTNYSKVDKIVEADNKGEIEANSEEQSSVSEKRNCAIVPNQEIEMVKENLKESKRRSKKKSLQEENIALTSEGESLQVAYVETKQSSAEEVKGLMRRSSRSKSMVQLKIEEKIQKESENEFVLTACSPPKCDSSKEDLPNVEEESKEECTLKSDTVNDEKDTQSPLIVDLQEEKVEDVPIVSKVPKRRGRKKKYDQTQDSQESSESSALESALINPPPRRSLRTNRFTEEIEEQSKNSSDSITQPFITNLEPFKVPEVTEMKKRTSKRKSITEDTQNIPSDEPEVNNADSLEEQFKISSLKDSSEDKNPEQQLLRSYSSNFIDLSQIKMRPLGTRHTSLDDLRIESADDLSEESTCMTEFSYFRKKRLSKKRSKLSNSKSKDRRKQNMRKKSNRFYDESLDFNTQLQLLREQKPSENNVLQSVSEISTEEKKRRSARKKISEDNDEDAEKRRRSMRRRRTVFYGDDLIWSSGKNYIGPEIQPLNEPKVDEVTKEVNQVFKVQPLNEPKVYDAMEIKEVSEDEPLIPNEVDEVAKEVKDASENLKTVEDEEEEERKNEENVDEVEAAKKKAQGNYVVVHKKTGEILIVEKVQKLTKEPARFFCEVCCKGYTRKGSLGKHFKTKSHLEKIKKSKEVVDDDENDVSNDEDDPSLFEEGMDISVDHLKEPDNVNNLEPINSCYSNSIDQNSLTNSQSTQQLEDELLDEEICKITENMSHDDYVLTDQLSPEPESTSTPKIEIKQIEEIGKKKKHDKKKAKGKKKNLIEDDSSSVEVTSNTLVNIKITVSNLIDKVAESKVKPEQEICTRLQENEDVGMWKAKSNEEKTENFSLDDKPLERLSLKFTINKRSTESDNFSSAFVKEFENVHVESVKNYSERVDRLNVTSNLKRGRTEDSRDENYEKESKRRSLDDEQVFDNEIQKTSEAVKPTRSKKNKKSKARKHLEETENNSEEISDQKLADSFEEPNRLENNLQNESKEAIDFENEKINEAVKSTRKKYKRNRAKKYLEEAENNSEDGISKENLSFDEILKLTEVQKLKECLLENNEINSKELEIVKETEKQATEIPEKSESGDDDEASSFSSLADKPLLEILSEQIKESSINFMNDSDEPKVEDKKGIEDAETKEFEDISSVDKNLTNEQAEEWIYSDEDCEPADALNTDKSSSESENSEALESLKSILNGVSYHQSKKSKSHKYSKDNHRKSKAKKSSKKNAGLTSESDDSESEDKEPQNKSKIVKSVFGRVFGGEKTDKVKEVLNDWVSKSDDDSDISRTEESKDRNGKRHSVSSSVNSSPKKRSGKQSKKSSSPEKNFKTPEEHRYGKHTKNNRKKQDADVSNDHYLSTNRRSVRHSKKRAEERISMCFAEGDPCRHDSAIVKDSGYGSFYHDEDASKVISLEEDHRAKRRKSSRKNTEEDWQDSKKESIDEIGDFVKNLFSSDLESSRSCSSLGSRDRSPSVGGNSQRESNAEEEVEKDMEGRISPMFIFGTPTSLINSSSNSENEEEDENMVINQTPSRKRSSSEFSGEKVLIKSPSSTHKSEVVTIEAIEDNALDVPQETAKSRQGKVLNFDEELFVECCSRLKATTENELRGAKKIKLDHSEGYHRKDDQQQGFRGPRNRWGDVESQNSLGSLLESVNQLLGEEMHSTGEGDYPKRGSRNRRSEHSSRSVSPDMSRADNLGYEDSLDVAFEHNNKLRDKIQQRMRESENLIASTFGQKNECPSKNNEQGVLRNSGYSSLNEQRHLSSTANLSSRGYNEALHVRGLQEQTSVNKGKVNSSLGGLLDKALSNLLHSNEKHDHNGSTPMKVLAELACARAPTSTTEDSVSPEVQEIKTTPNKDSTPDPNPTTIHKDLQKKSRNSIKELFERKKEMNDRKQQEKSKTEALRELNVHKQHKTKKTKKPQDFPLIRCNELRGLAEKKKRRETFERKEQFISDRIKDVYEFDEEESQMEPKLGSVLPYRSRPGYEMICLKTKEVDMADELISKTIEESLENGKPEPLSNRLESMINRKFKELEKFAPKTKGALKAFQSEYQQQIIGPMDEFVERKQSKVKKTIESSSKHSKLKKRSKNQKKKNPRTAWYENDSSDEYRTAVKAEDVGVGISKSQRTCSKGKQNIFAELYTSSESEFDDQDVDFVGQKKSKKTTSKTNLENVQHSQKYSSENEDHVDDWRSEDLKDDTAKHNCDNKKSESDMSDHPLVIDERKDIDEQRNSDEEMENQYERNFEMDDLYREDSSIADSDMEEPSIVEPNVPDEPRRSPTLPPEKNKTDYAQESELIPLEEALDLLDQVDSLGTRYVNKLEDDITTELEKETFDPEQIPKEMKCASPLEELEEELDNDLLTLPEKLSSNEKPQKESENLPLHVFLSRKVQESKKRKEEQLKKMQEEQERILMDLQPTRRQRKCAIGKQGLLAEISSSDEEISPRDRKYSERSDEKPRKQKRESKERRRERYTEKRHEQMIAKEQKAIEEEILREIEKKKEAQNTSDFRTDTDKESENMEDEVASAQKRKYQTKEKQKKNKDEEHKNKPLSDLENNCNKSVETNHEENHEESSAKQKKHSKSPTKPKKESSKISSACKKSKSSNSDKKNKTETKGSKEKERRSSSTKRDSDDEELKTTKSWNKVEEGVGVAIGRRKRAAANQLYYWSSSSDEEEVLEVVPAVVEEEDDRQEQHGWIVGDSHKRMITMLAREKKLKEKRRRSEDEFEPGRMKNKKHRNSTS